MATKAKKRKKQKKSTFTPQPLQLKGEVWKPIIFGDNIADGVKMHASNLGRIKSFAIDKVDGIILQQGLVNKYLAISAQKKGDPSIPAKNRRQRFYVHKVIAETFLTRPSEEHVFVLHLNYKQGDNWLYNLKWATKREKELHFFENPNYINMPTHKLSEGQVRIIKKKLADPNRTTRLKMIAKNFGISEMQLYRISSGENWGHVKI
jgi:hypothetical protein